ncbi:hypothetical protein C9439_05425 [archaeon SCG-AAA382B04]|nr:hypothetical protein C9439_05425 [archaeon SCG-AAA382B04]
MQIATLTIAFLAGIQTFFSPCAFPLLPAYLSYFIGQKNKQKNPIKIAIQATTGFAIIISILAALTHIIGQQIKTFFTKITPIIGIILIIIGIAWTLNKKPLSLSGIINIELPRQSATLFGAAYAITAITCMFPIVLSVVVTTLDQGIISLITTFLAYLAGMAIMMTIATTAASLSNQILLEKFKNYMNYVTRISGLIILLAGTYLLIKSLKYI